MTSSVEKRNHLFETASSQFGLFTAKQAVEAGYDRRHFRQHVASGEWVQELWGLYSLANFPSAPEHEYMKWLLWTRNRGDQVQGCLSHETALAVYELGDLMPNQIHLTVPLDFRRTVDVPALICLHYHNLSRSSIQIEKGLPVTTPLKTLEDMVFDGKTEITSMEQALDKALTTGMITKRQVVESTALKGLRV